MFNKKAKILGIILIIILVFVLLVVGAAVYFYYFHIFKTIRVCISDNETDSLLPCETDSDCEDFVLESFLGLGETLNSLPEPFSQKMEQIIEKSIYCEETCKTREIRGLENIDDFSAEGIEQCRAEEEEIKLEVRGKELIQLLRVLKKETLD